MICKILNSKSDYGESLAFVKFLLSNYYINDPNRSFKIYMPEIKLGKLGSAYMNKEEIPHNVFHTKNKDLVLQITEL